MAKKENLQKDGDLKILMDAIENLCEHINCRNALDYYPSSKSQTKSKNFYDAIKRLACTSSNFTGFSELFIFWAIKNELEKSLGKFKSEEIKDGTENEHKLHQFKNENKDVIMAMNVPLKHLIKSCKKNLKPDSAVVRKKELIAVFSVKASIISKDKLIKPLKNELKVYAKKTRLFFLVFEMRNKLPQKFSKSAKQLIRLFKDDNLFIVVHEEDQKEIGETLKPISKRVITFQEAVEKVKKILK